MCNSTPKQRIWTKDFILIVLSNFFLFTAFQMTLPTLPLFIQDIGVDDRWIGIVVGVFTFSALLLRPNAGRMLDTKGRRPVFLMGLLFFVISMFSIGLTHTIFMLLLVRIMQGAGWGLSSTASGTIATDLIPVNRRGEGLGYYGLSANIALAFGPALGLLLVDHISFTMLFSICAILGLISLTLAMNINYVKPQEHKEKPKERRVLIPRIDVIEKSALPAAILLFFVTVTFGGIASFLPLYTFELGFPSVYMQLYFLVYAVFLLLSRLTAGKVYDKHGVTIVFIPGVSLIIIAMVMLSFMTHPYMLLVASSLYGFGFGCLQPTLQAWAVSRAKPERRGMANATYFSAFDTGVGVGAVSFGFIAEFFSYQTIYVVSTMSVVLALFIFIFVFSKEKFLPNRNLHV